jgi:hypothetical protein
MPKTAWNLRWRCDVEAEKQPVAAWVPVNEMEKFLKAAIDGAVEELMKMLVPIGRAPENMTGDAFDVFVVRERIATLRRCHERLKAIRRDYT